MVVVADILGAPVGVGEKVLVLGPEVDVEHNLADVSGVAKEVPRVVVAGVEEEEVLVAGLVKGRSRFSFVGGVWGVAWGDE